MPLSAQPVISVAPPALGAESGFIRALNIFHAAAQRVPAYKDFLRRYRVKPEDITTPEDFIRVPQMTKKNYLNRYPLKDLLWDGNLDSTRIISVSSGSSGKPFYWPRGDLSITQSAFLHAELLDTLIDRGRPTLAIVSFAMGTWIAGTYTLDALTELSRKGFKLTTVTPGIAKPEIINILNQLAPYYDQTLIFGYPPFIKDALDAIKSARLQLHRGRPKVILAGESFSETWRDYIHQQIAATDPLRSSAAIYGTADAGFMGCETPLTIWLRRMLDNNLELRSQFFPDIDRLPVIVQYNPRLRYFEHDSGQLIFTVNNSLPLIRYAIGDLGLVISSAELRQLLKNTRQEVPAELQRYTGRPIVGLYGRRDVATSFYALNIYPENIRGGLEQPTLRRSITGKFVIETRVAKLTLNQTLHLYIELAQGVREHDDLRRLILANVLNHLTQTNSEYRKLTEELKSRAYPVMHLLPFNHQRFQYSVKHRWISRS